MNSNIFAITLSYILYILFFIDFFINLPMNGYFRLLSKDNTIIVGYIISIVLSIVVVKYFVLPLYVSIPLLMLYFYYKPSITYLLPRVDLLPKVSINKENIFV